MLRIPLLYSFRHKRNSGNIDSKISLVTPEDTLIVNIAEPEAVPEDEEEEAAEE